MKSKLLMKKLHMEGKDFATATEMKKYCEGMDIRCDTAVRYLLSRGHLVRVFRGIFYVKSPDEMEMGGSRLSPMELVAKGLEMKGVKNWYFGLHSALKLNNITHEHFAVEDVINDSIFRSSPMTVAGSKFKFWKIKPSLTSFGVTGDGLRHSDPEKTILDFIYMWRARGTPEEKIILDVSEWAKTASPAKAKRYSGHYPKTVADILKRVMG